MKLKSYTRLSLVLLALAFVVFAALNNALFSNLRLDLTESRLYTISTGTREVIRSIDEPIDLYFFYSDAATRDLAPLRNYSRRVRELLEEYALQADGKIRLSIVDPEPFSEAEDQAAAFGLQAVPLTLGGDQIYFGLAGTNAYGEEEVIGFFQPDREEFLEYELSSILSNLAQPQRTVIGLISGLQIGGGFDMTTARPTPAWTVVEQMRQLFEVRTIAVTETSIDPEVSLLMIVHPGDLAEEMRYAIDQFVLGGGHAIVFVDPLAESSAAGANPMTRQSPVQTASNLPALFKAWGVELVEGKIVGDRQHALMISADPTQGPVQHLAYLGLNAANMNQDDVIVSDLESINLGAAGALRQIEGATTEFIPLLQSSQDSMLLDALQVQMMRDPRQLLTGFIPDQERYTLVARVAGTAKSSFAGPLQEGGAYIAEGDSINVLLVADADMLADRFWVQLRDFFGQQIATAWADNASLVLNSLENLGGSSALISIRSRGRYSRPFTVVQQLRAQAEARNLETADRLQRKLDETEQRLAEIEQTKEDQNMLVLTPEQEAALLQFQQEKLDIRKQLREVRHQLNSDIEQLGTVLKLINIVLMPLLMTLLLWIGHRLYVRRAANSSQSA